MRPSSSVVIPVRNRSLQVSAAIQSVQRQTLQVEEIIIVDDASTDGTDNTVERMAESDRRIRLIRCSERRGASCARNLGIEATTKDWISFLDSDDQWLPEKHERQWRAVQENKEAIACFTGIRIISRFYSRERISEGKITIATLRQRNCLGSTSTAMVRRRSLLEVGMFDPNLTSCQDWDLYLKLRKRGDFVIVQEPMILYSEEDTRRISRDKDNVLAGHRTVFKRALEDVHTAEEAERISAFHDLRLAEVLFYDFGDLSTAVKLVRSAFRRCPSAHALPFLLSIPHVWIGRQLRMRSGQ